MTLAVQAADTFARVPYQSSAIERTLVRNGKAFSRRDETGSDKETVGWDVERHRVNLRDGRAVELSLDVNGFTMAKDPLQHVNYYKQSEVTHSYYAECERLVRQATGAAYVIAFDHNVRSASAQEAGKRIDGGNLVQGPAAIAHADYTVASGQQRLLDLAKPPKTNDTLRGRLGDTPAVPADLAADVVAGRRRFAIVNVWRPITKEPVESKPLALLDAATTSAEDLSVFEIRYIDRVGENYFASQNPKHVWYYFSAMCRDEAILLKTFDSLGTYPARAADSASQEEGRPIATFAVHSAVDDEQTPKDGRDRESIEVRCVVVY